VTLSPHTVIVGMDSVLGPAIARRFGQTGQRISLVSPDPAALAREVADLADAGIEAMFASASVTDVPALHDALDKVAAAWGTPNTVVFLASEHVTGRITSIDADGVGRALATSALGSIAVMQALLPAMAQRGSGAFLVAGSGSALDPLPHELGDGAASAALRAITLAAARDHERDGVHIAMITINGDPAASTRFEPAAISDAFWDVSQEPAGAWCRERVFSGSAS
jgi:NAD(P)-dependent dehydrogenase (short-subunit alcohol dehydrogenase family)